MRIGAICRCDNTGLGIQSKEFFDNIPCKALVIDVSNISDRMEQNHNWYPNMTVFKIEKVGGLDKIPKDIILDFIKDIDVLITFESPYDYRIFEMCRERGIKTVLQLNYEFLEYPNKEHNYPMPDLLAAPSPWHYSNIMQPKTYLPVPVNTDKIKPAAPAPRLFIHIIGNKAVHDRNGTDIFLQSLQHVKEKILVVVFSQFKMPSQTRAELKIPDNVDLVFTDRNAPNYYENYPGGVLVMPRKFGGLCLPAQEAIAAGMPVIMTDVCPNNKWLPWEWLVPAEYITTFRCKKFVDVYHADPVKLAEKIDEFCDKDFYNAAVEKTRAIKHTISWDTLRPTYMEMFKKLVDGL